VARHHLLPIAYRRQVHARVPPLELREQPREPRSAALRQHLPELLHSLLNRLLEIVHAPNYADRTISTVGARQARDRPRHSTAPASEDSCGSRGRSPRRSPPCGRKAKAPELEQSPVRPSAAFTHGTIPKEGRSRGATGQATRRAMKSSTAVPASRSGSAARAASSSHWRGFSLPEMLDSNFCRKSGMPSARRLRCPTG